MSFSLWMLNKEIEALDFATEDGMYIHPETGELMTFEQALDALKMERSEKMENIALWVKNLTAEAAAIKAEEDSLTKRRKAAEAKCASLKGYLMAAMVREDGTAESFRTARCTVSVRMNKSSVVCDEEILPAEYKTVTTTEKPNKTLLYELLKSGEIIPGAHLETSRSVMIK